MLMSKGVQTWDRQEFRAQCARTTLLDFATGRRFCAAILGQSADCTNWSVLRPWTAKRHRPASPKLIEPFNKKGVTVADATRFTDDLEFDSLTVMDFVAAIEDEFDIIISMNQQAEIETYGQLVDAVVKLQG